MKAIAEFGSTSRNESDEHSDRDLLIIMDGSWSRAKIARQFSSIGYSCSTLSPSQISFMAKKGSLFVQHLKHEARIIWDDQASFKIFLQEAPFVSPSAAEIAKCKDALRYSLSPVPRQELHGWQSDFVYCISRDILIKNSAQLGLAVFGLNELIKTLPLDDATKSEALEVMRGLRLEKSRFRKGEKASVHATSLITRWRCLAAEIFQLQLPTESFESSVRQRKFSSNYEVLRVLEYLDLIAKIDGTKQLSAQMKRMISAPNKYRSCQAHRTPMLIHELSKMVGQTSSNGRHPSEIADT
ncbi:hypothetical protein [Stenotrophomonas sp. TWI377]|uniref:hypothetical protein n=1 Tax=Stenotrophomonas sp. TWI377 TaxID=3136775 RepID=UPI0032080614